MNTFINSTLHCKIKKQTASEHERLRNLMVSLDLFNNIGRYKNFTLAQYYFHVYVTEIFNAHHIAHLISGIKCTERFNAIKKDMEDLGIVAENDVLEDIKTLNIYEALGWLYVSEGSTLGAAILLKSAKASYYLSEHFGARNLAEYSEGRLKYWENFINQLNQLNLSLDEQHLVVDGAFSAFNKFGTMLENLDELI